MIFPRASYSKRQKQGAKSHQYGAVLLRLFGPLPLCQYHSQYNILASLRVRLQ